MQTLDRGAHAAEVEAWRQERYARLLRPMSWLTLAGLSWLRPGDNRLGSDPAVELSLPGGPPIAGRLTLTDGAVTAEAAPGSGLAHGGEPVEALPMVADVDAPDGEPTLLELGPLRMCLIRRGDRIGLRTWDTASPARSAFIGIPHYPVDPAWRVVARFEPAPVGATMRVPDVIGEVTDEPLPGSVSFEIDGRPCRLDALEGGDAGELWLVFGDATNGDTTYPGGRFLYTDAPAAGGTVVVDFNRAYNPPCVFSPWATCPLPPAGNRLPVRIEAGEQWPTGGGREER